MVSRLRSSRSRPCSVETRKTHGSPGVLAMLSISGGLDMYRQTQMRAGAIWRSRVGQTGVNMSLALNVSLQEMTVGLGVYYSVLSPRL